MGWGQRMDPERQVLVRGALVVLVVAAFFSWDLFRALQTDGGAGSKGKVDSKHEPAGGAGHHALIQGADAAQAGHQHSLTDFEVRRAAQKGVELELSHRGAPPELGWPRGLPAPGSLLRSPL